MLLEKRQTMAAWMSGLIFLGFSAGDGIPPCALQFQCKTFGCHIRLVPPLDLVEDDLFEMDEADFLCEEAPQDEDDLRVFGLGCATRWRTSERSQQFTSSQGRLTVHSIPVFASLPRPAGV